MRSQRARRIRLLNRLKGQRDVWEKKGISGGDDYNALSKRIALLESREAQAASRRHHS